VTKVQARLSANERKVEEGKYVCSGRLLGRRIWRIGRLVGRLEATPLSGLSLRHTGLHLYDIGGTKDATLLRPMDSYVASHSTPHTKMSLRADLVSKSWKVERRLDI
jgi:hypothetical protein